MPTATEPAQGATYVLDDYTVIQVVVIAGQEVGYRARGRAWPWRRARTVSRVMPVAAMMGRIRAEIDGAFFPELVAPGPHRFRHAAEEVAGLRRHLDQRASHRPFAPAG